MAKKEFAWDKEEVLGYINVSEKEERKVSICELNEKQYVAVAKSVLVKGDWKIVSNATFPIAVFEEVNALVTNHLKSEVK